MTATMTRPITRRPHFADAAQYEAYHRTMKARRVAEVLLSVEANPFNLTDAQWEMAEQIAQVNPLSAESRAVVVALMTTL